MLRLRRGMAETAFTLPDQDNDIANWNAVKAELMAKKLTEVALCHEGQMERLNEQVVALRRMNSAIIAIKDKVQNATG